MLSPSISLALTLALFSPNALAASSSLPRIDFSRLGTVGIAGTFAGLSLFSASSNTTANPLASTLLSRSASDGSLTPIGITEDGGQIYAACELDSKVYVGGAFSQLGGTSAQNIISYDPSSSTFTALPNGGLNGPAHALYCDSSNHLLWIGGNFTEPAGPGVALYSTSNSSWVAAPFAGLSGQVLSITPSASSQSLYFAGSFITAYQANGTNATYGNNPNVPYSAGATPYSSSLVPIPLAGADINAAPVTTQSGFTDIANILCPAGPDGAGNTWLAQDGSAAQITVRVYRNEGVSGFRLGNTFVQGRGTTAFTITTLPNNQVLPLSYVDPATNTTQNCSSSCSLLTEASIPYQDFIFTSTPAATITGFQLTLNSWSGSGAGLHLLQLLSEGSFASFVPGLDIASCFSPGPTTVTQSGTWQEVNVTTATPGTLQPVLQATFPTSTSPASSPSLDLSVYVSAVGYYTVYLMVPGCTQMQDCDLRTTVQATISPGNGVAPVTQEIDQRVEVDTMSTIYRGPLYPSAPTFSIPVSLRLSDTPAGQGGGGNFDIVADQVQFVLTAAPNGTYESAVGQGVPGYNATLSTGIARSFGIFEWALSGGGRANATGTMANGSETTVDSAGAAMYAAILGASNNAFSGASVGQFGSNVITSLAPSSSPNEFFIGGTFSLSTLGAHNIAMWNGTQLVSLPSGGPNGGVAALALDSSAGQLYIGGNFTGLSTGSNSGYGGVARYDIGQNEWASMGGGVNGPVTGLSLNGSQLTVVGNFTGFTSDKSLTAAGLAMWSTSSGSWTSAMGFVVGNLSFTSSDSQYLAGNVIASAGYAADGWAMIQADGSGNPEIVPQSGVQFTGFSTSNRTSGAVSKRAASSFPHSNGHGKRYIDMLKHAFSARQASTAPPLPPAPAAPAPAVLAGAFWNNGSDQITILGGNFSYPSGGGTADAVALYDSSKGSVTPLSGPQLNGTVRALLVANNVLFIGGEFTQSGSQSPGLAMYDLNAQQWITAFQALQPETGSNVVVRSITSIPSSPAIVVVAGSFASAGSLPCVAICAWDTTNKQWNSLGPGVKGEATTVAYAGSDSGIMIVGGSLQTSAGSVAPVLEYNIGNLTWETLGPANELPGPVTALTVDNYNASSVFVAGRATDGSTSFFSHYDGQQWSSVDATLDSESIVAQIAVMPMMDSHDSNPLVETDRMLLVSGSLSSSSMGNISSALFDGQSWHPYLTATTSTGSTGAIAALFYSASSITYGIGNFLAVGLVILISIVIGAGIVIVLFLIGVFIALWLRRSENTPQPLAEKDDDDASSMNHHPSMLLEHVQAATRATIIGESAFAAAGGKGRSPDGSHEHMGDDSMETDEMPAGAAGTAPVEEGQVAHARYSFEASAEGELDVRAGTQVQVLDDRDASWWLVRDLETGREGIIPASYLL